MGYFKMEGTCAATSVSIADWLRRHGRAVRPALSRRERRELEVRQLQ